jgi:predicted phosphate transport protein (TIGR00153 family)
MGSLKKWLQTRNEENLMGKTVAFVQKVLEVVVEFERGFNFMISEKEFPLALDVFNRVNTLEHEADIMRRELMLQVATSDMDAATREDIAGLITAIDEVANSANAAGRRLGKMSETHVRALGDSVLKLIIEMIQRSVDATKLLFNLIKRFPDMESKEVFSSTEQIQRLEHKCDINHAEILQKLTQMEHFPFNPFVAIDLKDIIDMIEGISDKVEDVADYIELLKTILR